MEINIEAQESKHKIKEPKAEPIPEEPSSKNFKISLIEDEKSSSDSDTCPVNKLKNGSKSFEYSSDSLQIEPKPVRKNSSGNNTPNTYAEFAPRLKNLLLHAFSPTGLDSTSKDFSLK